MDDAYRCEHCNRLVAEHYRCPCEDNPPDPNRAAAESCFEDVVGREPEPDNAMDQRAVGALYQRLRALVEREQERIAGEIKEYFYSGEVVGYLLDRIRPGKEDGEDG